MGLVAVSAGVTSAGGSIGLLSSVGQAIGGLFVSIALIYLFAYLTIIDASDTDRAGVRTRLIAAILPLSVAFSGMILYASLQYI